MKNLLVFLLFSLLTFSVFPQNSEGFPSLEPFFYYKDGELSPDDFILSGLEFSLCPPESDAAKASLAKFKALEAEVKSDSFMSLPEEERGEKILTLMYEKLLTRYKSMQTRLDVMFQDGTYNCVSSSVLYFALAKAAALDVHAVEAPEHAFCTLYLPDGRKIDVETTNPIGFYTGTKRKIQASENPNHYYVATKKNYSKRHEISERKLISLIGGNIATLNEKKRNYELSIPMEASVMVFLEKSSEEDQEYARKEFDGFAKNYANFLNKQKNFELALDWLDSVENRWGKAALSGYADIYNDITYNCVVNLTNKKKAEKAQEFFDAKKDKIDEKTRKQISEMIFFSKIDENTEGMEAEEAIAFIQESKKSPEAKDGKIAKKLESREEYYWSKKAEPLSKEEKFLEAAAIMGEGLKSLPNNRNLQIIRKQNLNNYAVLIHNQFVNLFNTEKFDEAEELLNEGLKTVPQNITLQRDLKMLKSKKNAIATRKDTAVPHLRSTAATENR